MAASTFKILKQCLMCGNMFEAQKVTTAYCSHRCNSKHYKLKVKLNKKELAESQVKQYQKLRPKAAAISRAMIKDREFLTVKDIAVLFHCSPKTIYSLIRTGKLKAANISTRKTLLKRSNIEKLFE